MTKIQKISKTISPFAGIFFANDEFKSSGLGKLIDKQLGIRVSTKGYTYSNLIRNFFNLYLSGGDCAEDIHEHFRPTLEQIPNNTVASPDTLLRSYRELATANITVVSTGAKFYKFNINDKLNDLNIKSLILTKQIKKGEFYDFDYDNQIIEHEKDDAKKTYKNNSGYFPGIGSIGNHPVYIENRDGNAHVKLNQSETLSRCFMLLQNNAIYLNRMRMDAGSYSEDIVKTVSANCRFFYIRANKCASLTERIRQINDWKEVEINDKRYHVASLEFTQFLSERGFRLVVMREKGTDPQLDLFTGDNCIYRSILTNDWHSSEKEVIEYYNLRGGSEKIFDVMNNDFGWNRLPSSDMNTNTVYMILTAMLKNFYHYILGKVSNVFPGLSPTSRLKRFIFRFIAVAGHYVRRGRQWYLRLYTDRPYDVLLT